ncbi:MAG: FG-GAP repeat protein [Rhodospirillales bacterium]|nr:FG-GAP repeat protein [Rhodospirillales bacterium]
MKQPVRFLLRGISLMLGALCLINQAEAACSSPAGTAGKMIFNADHHMAQYCDGTDWVAMGRAISGGGADWGTATQSPTIPNPVPAAIDGFGYSVAVSGTTAVIGVPFDDPGGVSDAGSAYVFDTTTGNLVATLNNPAPTASDYFGVNVAVDGTVAVIGAFEDDPGGVTGAGSAYVFDTTTGNLIATLNNPAPTASDYFGYSVAVSGTTAVVGAYLDDPGGVSGAGSAYVFDTTTGNLIATLNNPAPTASDYFGYSVAVSGTTAVVGAYLDDPGGVSGAGSAYVFDTTTGNLIATLNNPAPNANDAFGVSIAVDGTVAVIGAFEDNPGGVSNAGSAYVFNTTTGNLIATLNNPAPTASDLFGNSVAVSGTTAVVGAYLDDPGGVSGAGSAYVFDTTTGTLLATLNNPDPTWGDNFGNSVAMSGATAVVGAPYDDPGGVSNAGSVYVFTAGTAAPSGGGGADWGTATQSPTIPNPVPAASDGFGNSVAVSGTTAVIGVPFDDPGGVNDVGSAYVFDTTTGNLIATLNNPDPTASDQFGKSVAVSGTTAVIGAYWDSPGGVFGAGSAYVFDAITGNLVATLNNPDPTLADYFGWIVAVSGTTAVVGAFLDDPGGVNDAGSAYVFDTTTGNLITTLNNPAPAAGDYFGISVAVSGTTAVIGANQDDPGGVNGAGSAYVFDTTTGNLITTLNNPAPAADDYFGVSVSVSGTIAVVGANQDDPGGVNGAGSAYVFDTTTGNLITTLNNPAPAADDHFGMSVAVSGTTAVVGAPADDPGGVSGAGSAYVFDTTTGNLLATLNNPDPTASDIFGNSVVVDGTTAVVGAFYDDPGGVNGAGSAYVFTAGVLGFTPGKIEYNADDHLMQFQSDYGVHAMGPPGDGGVGCSNPAGVEGEMIYNADHSVMQYCEGDVWVGIGK